MNYIKILFWFQAIALLMLFSCTSQKVNQTSTDRLYKKENNELTAKYTIYHVNDSISQLYYDISNESLLYKKTDTSAAFYSNIKLLLKINSEDNPCNGLRNQGLYRLVASQGFKKTTSIFLHNLLISWLGSYF